MIYHALITLNNDCKLSIIKRCSQIKRAPVFELGAFHYFRELEPFDEYAMGYWLGKLDWRTGDLQVFDGVPFDDLRSLVTAIGIKDIKPIYNLSGFEQDFL